MAKKNKAKKHTPMVAQVLAGAEQGLAFAIAPSTNEVLTPQQVKAQAALDIIASADSQLTNEEADATVDNTPHALTDANVLTPTAPVVVKPSFIEQLGEGAEIVNKAVTQAGVALYEAFVTLGKGIWGTLAIVGMAVAIGYAYLWYGIGRIVRFHARAFNHGFAGFNFGKLPNMNEAN